MLLFSLVAIRLNDATAIAFFTTKHGVNNSIGATDPRFHRYGAYRTIGGTCPAFHTEIPVMDPGRAVIKHEYLMRTHNSTHSATDTCFSIKPQGDYIP